MKLQLESEIARALKKPVPEEKMKDMLLKMRKGADAWLTFGKMVQVLHHLGWEIVPFAGWTPRHYLYEGKRWHLVDESTGRGLDSSGLKRLHAELKSVETDRLPDSPSHIGEVVVMEVGPIQTPMGDPMGINFFYRKEWVGTEGVILKSPRGQEEGFLPDHHDVDRKRLDVSDNSNTHDVWSWAKKEGGILEDVNAALGTEEHVPGAKRTRENTGTCAACFGNHKMDVRGGIVLHGYQRPGIGYVVGDCYCVGYKPLELSVDGAVAFQKAIGAALPKMMAKLVALQGGSVTKLNTGYKGEKTISKGDFGFERELDNQIYREKRDIEAIERDVEMFAKIISAWRPRPLPTAGEREHTPKFFLK